MSEITNL